jgi:uncharacterized protein (UPF0333 family)
MKRFADLNHTINFTMNKKNFTKRAGKFSNRMKPMALMLEKTSVLLMMALLLTASVVAQETPAVTQSDDQSLVKVAAAELIVVNSEAAYGNLTLLTHINGATITWSSSNKKIITPSGEVTRPKGSDAKVVLRATIVKGAATATKDITVRVVKAFKKAVDEAYLFVHFTFTEEKIHFSLSKGNNALDWQELNNGKPVFISNIGTTGLRDPYIKDLTVNVISRYGSRMIS